jgi:hypothetical protein
MRSLPSVLAVMAMVAVAYVGLPMVAHAQYSGGRGGGPDEQQQEDEAKKKKRDQEFGTNLPSLPQLKNAGPCPFVKSLYDAARYVEFAGGQEASASVGYTGEIENISAGCAYKATEPIREKMEVLFEFGRGPQATSSHKVYRYWVAVTDRNRAVLAKETFDLPVTFPSGQDRVMVREDLAGVTIPRADSQVSRANFEILIGFEVTPEMADFNRQGKRFKPNVMGQTTAQAASTTQ